MRYKQAFERIIATVDLVTKEKEGNEKGKIGVTK